MPSSARRVRLFQVPVENGATLSRLDRYTVTRAPLVLGSPAAAPIFRPYCDEFGENSFRHQGRRDRRNRDEECADRRRYQSVLGHVRARFRWRYSDG
jgi:hypothetical protein